MSGAFDNTIDFGTVSLPSGGSTDAFAAKLDGSGSIIWAKAFGDASPQGYVSGESTGPRIAADSTGASAVAGHMTSTIDVGTGALVSAGGEDAFVAKFSP